MEINARTSMKSEIARTDEAASTDSVDQAPPDVQAPTVSTQTDTIHVCMYV